MRLTPLGEITIRSNSLWSESPLRPVELPLPRVAGPDSAATGTALEPSSTVTSWVWLAERCYVSYLGGGNDATELLILGSLEIARRVGDDVTERRLRASMVLLYADQRRLDDATTWGEALIRNCQAIGDHACAAVVLGFLAAARFRVGDVGRGTDALVEGLNAVRRSPLRGPLAPESRLAVALAAVSADMFETTIELTAVAEKAARLDHRPLMVSTACSRSALAHLSWALRLRLLGRDDDARPHWRAAISAIIRCQQVGATADATGWDAAVSAYEALAWVYLDEPDIARSMIPRVLADPQALHLHPNAVLAANLVCAMTARAAGERDKATDHLNEALANDDPTTSGAWHSVALRELVELQTAESTAVSASTVTALRLATMLAGGLWDERERRLESIEVQLRLTDLAAENRDAHRASLEDPLTGLGNRRCLDAALDDLSQHRPAGAISMIFVDIDDFKAVNDTLSHGIGDLVLVDLAGLLTSHCRGDDVVVRFGGDEFVLVLREVPVQAAATIAERIRRSVLSHEWNRIHPALRIRVSVGVAEHRAGMDFRDVVKAADRAVYASKKLGRNRVSIAS
jgi:diguanylate cyclase